MIVLVHKLHIIKENIPNVQCNDIIMHMKHFNKHPNSTSVCNIFQQSTGVFASEARPNAVITVGYQRVWDEMSSLKLQCLTRHLMFHANSFFDASSKFSTKSTNQTMPTCNIVSLQL